MAEELVERRLNQIVRILALNATKDDEKDKDKVLKLTKMGFNTEEIAEFLGMGTNEIIKIHLADVLDSEKKKQAYLLTAQKTQSQICKALKISPPTLSELWQECARRGLMSKEGKRYKPLFDLQKYKLIAKGSRPIEPQEDDNDQEKEGTENN